MRGSARMQLQAAAAAAHLYLGTRLPNSAVFQMALAPRGPVDVLAMNAARAQMDQKYFRMLSMRR